MIIFLSRSLPYLVRENYFLMAVGWSFKDRPEHSPDRRQQQDQHEQVATQRISCLFILN